jgi:DNA invertase Pin-like site-specific DNA recombinase
VTTATRPHPVRRCALYTRKSSEEGLDQAFNSLDAQREACAAYVRSQKAEGWKALPDLYDDGGFSGGSMERPALKRLLADIAAGRIDIVVVYKIDRLTRSLADFARMVELFEHHQVSFVSVTQSFNTTTSMGRLTLNVLLSFAQFEREVTGERIRDKIAASKARGLWMGGAVPLGYDRAAEGTRTLVINEAEAATVRTIFKNYLDLGSVHALERHLRSGGIRSKLTISVKGACRGGVAFSRGSLFHLLRNRIYRGEIVHKGKVHPGLHPAIIEADLFDAVQTRLASQTRRSPTGDGKVSHSALTGRIVDADGQPMSPAAAYGRHGALYRYYVSAPLQQGGKRAPHDPHPRRVAAAPLEAFLADRLSQRLIRRAGSDDPDRDDPDKALDLIHRVEVREGRLIVTLPADDPTAFIQHLREGEQALPDPSNPGHMRLILPCHLSTRRGRTEIIGGDKAGPRQDPTLIRALRQAHALVDRDRTGLPTLDTAPDTPYRNQLVRLAFLAPDLQQAILAGRQPQGLTLARLLDGRMPFLWQEQREMFGEIVPRP